MKTTKQALLSLLALGASASLLLAQDNSGPQPPDGNGPPRHGQGGPRGPGGQRPGMGGQQLPKPPIIAALDANNDGTIDADEIANASAALKKLDQNGDGKLTGDELRPARPEGQGGPGGPGGPRGQNGPGRQVGPDGGDRPPRRPANAPQE